MARLKPIPPDRLSPEAIELLKHRPERLRSGPFTVWLHRPELAKCIAPLMGYMRRGGMTVPTRLAELAILIAARAWTAQFAWYAHEPQALAAGVDPKIIEAIRHRRRPEFERDDEAAVYAFASELLENRAVSEPTYAKALALLGEATLIDLVNLLGFYQFVATTLVTFGVEVPGGQLPLDA